MELQDHHINKFITLYEKHYGVVLERTEALKKGLELCRFIELVEGVPSEDE